MFEKMMAWLRRMLEGLFETSGAAQKPDIIISTAMESAISRWAKAYEGRPPWQGKDTKAIGLAAGIAAEIARMVVMESDILVSGSPRADWLNLQMDFFRDDLEVSVELAAALGGIVFKPYVVDNRLVIDTVQGDCFFPTAFDSSRRMTGVIFVEQIKRGPNIFTRLEKHDFSGASHCIRNKVYCSGNAENLGKEIKLVDVPEWADIGEEVSFENVDRPLFGYLRMPFANRIDRHSPLGVSAFANAESLLQDADEQYGRYLWEYEGGALAIDATEDYLKSAADGTKVLPKGKERLFRGLKTKEPDFYKVFSPELRDESLKRGLNTLLQRIEFNCGLAYGTLSDPQNVDKTAEEIRAGKQRSYNTIKGVQRAIEAAITDLVYAMDRLASRYNIPEAGTGDYELTCDWDDSITNDPQQRKQVMLTLVMAGKFPLWRYLMDFEGYSEEESRKMQAETSKELGEPYADTGIS